MGARPVVCCVSHDSRDLDDIQVTLPTLCLVPTLFGTVIRTHTFADSRHGFAPYSPRPYGRADDPIQKSNAER